MRLAIVAAMTLAACTASPAAHVSTSMLAAADAATSLGAAEQLTMTRTIYEAPPDTGQDPTVLLTLAHPDGRVLSFTELNHTPMHVMAQAPGGPLAQIMGMFGEERPSLYAARAEGSQGAPFFCAPDGPTYLGVYEGAEGQIQIVGLRQGIGFETRPDGSYEPLPYSPDLVCARLRFRRN